MTKKIMHEIVDSLPDRFTVEEMIDAVVRYYRIQISLGQIDEFSTEEELDEQAKKWKSQLYIHS